MNKSLSAQIVPLLVLVVALLGVSSYVFGLDADTDVKTSIDALLPNQAVSADGSISVRYPDDWQQAEGALSFAPEDDETTNIAVSAQAGTIDDYLQNNSEATAYCAGDVCGYTRPGIFEGAGELQFYVVPGGENQIVKFDYVTAPGEADKYQEVLNGMIRTVDFTPSDLEVLSELPFAVLTLPVGWSGVITHEPAHFAQISDGTDNISLFVTELAAIPGLFQLSAPEGELTIDSLLASIEAGIPPEQIAEGITPVTIGEYSGSYINLAGQSQTGELTNTELIFLNIPESDQVLTVLVAASESTFPAAHSAAEQIVNSLVLDFSEIETSADTTNEGEDGASDPEETDRIPDEPEGISTNDGEATDRIPDEPEGISTESTVLELTETFTDGVVTSLNHPADWQVSVEPLGETGFSSVSLLSSTSNLSLFPVTTEFALTDLFGMPLPVDDIQPEDGFTIFLTGLGAEFIEEQTPLTIGEYTGSKAVLSNNGAPVEFGFVTLDNENLVVYSLDGAPESFETAHATAYEIIRTMELDMSLVGVPAIEDASDTEADATDSETTDDTSDASDAEVDATDSEATDDTSDATDTEVDAIDSEATDDTSDASDTETDTSVEVTVSEDRPATDDTSDASDTDTEADATDGETTEDTSDANDAESDTNVEVTVSETRSGVEALPLGNPFTNSDIGLTVEVPEGFNARGDSNYLYVDQIATSMRFAIGTPEEIAERLELELVTIPNEDVAVNLMTQFATNAEHFERYDSVSGVTVNDNGNRAYVDATRSSAKRRFLVLELEDGRLLYVELKARVDDFDVMSATTLAMLENMVVEAPADE